MPLHAQVNGQLQQLARRERVQSCNIVKECVCVHGNSLTIRVDLVDEFDGLKVIRVKYILLSFYLSFEDNGLLLCRLHAAVLSHLKRD